MNLLEIAGLVFLALLALLIISKDGHPTTGMYDNRSMYEDFNVEDVDPSSENIVPDNNQYWLEDREDDRNGYHPEDEQDGYEPQPEDSDYETE